MKMKWTIALVGALVLTLGLSSSMAQVTYTFGSDNDGLAGFTQTVTSTNETWTTLAGAVQYDNSDPGTMNGALLKTIGIDRTPGTTTSMSGTFRWINGYADDNNRIALYLFADDDNLANEDQPGIAMVWNYDSPSGGTNPDDEITLRSGLDNIPAFSPDINRDTTTYDVPTEMLGTEITLGMDITFNLDGTMSLLGSLTDDQGNVTTVTNTSTLLAADYLGNNFGFATRGRARNILIGGSNSEPQVFNYESFTVIPEPGTLSLVALMGGGMLFIRRRFRK